VAVLVELGGNDDIGLLVDPQVHEGFFDRVEGGQRDRINYGVAVVVEDRQAGDWID